MDAVRFGRWISERRRAAGWRSQKALVEIAHQDPLLNKQGISEDFLARLEAGRLAHPFRKGIRHRVLVLASLLCDTPREVQTYLHAAELTDLSAEEINYVNRLNEQLAIGNAPAPILLPPRPSRLIGRETMTQELTNILCSLETGVCAVTGMAGVGKSALAFEAVHRVASNERLRTRIFPDGIAIFSGKGRRGIHGLTALLEEIITSFSTPGATKKVTRVSAAKPAAVLPAPRFMRVPVPQTDGALALARDSVAVMDIPETDLAGVIDRVHQALAGKRLLLILDDLDAQFPLRLACEALLTQEQRSAGQGRKAGKYGARVVLVTSRYIPAPAVANYHLHAGPLTAEAALALFSELVDRVLSDKERTYAAHICEAVGYLPLAIEAAASAVSVAHIPLALLAKRVADHPLDALLDGEGEIRSTLAHVLDTLEPQLQRRFALLATLGTQSFGLESAAVAYTAQAEIRTPEASSASLYIPEHPANNIPAGTIQHAVEPSLTHLASTAADLGQLVRLSLVEVVPDHSSPAEETAEQSGLYHPRYRLHPLLYAQALERLEHIEPQIAQVARRNVQNYALAYLEHHANDPPALERERDFLLAVLEQAWQQKEHAPVVYMTQGLLPLTSDLISSERMLRWGIHASRHLQDQYHTALFLSRLGTLLMGNGQLTQARHMLEQSLSIAESLDRPVSVGRSFINLAHIAHIQGELDAARHFTELCVEKASDVTELVMGHYCRGFYARLQGDLDKAFDDQMFCLRQLSGASSLAELHDDIFLMSVQAELARVEGDYARSRAYMEAALALAQGTEAPYMIADMLFDQADFARQQGIQDDVRLLAMRVAEIAAQLQVPHLQKRALALVK